MLSDLTVGDKLSLKGKIFELSKQLKLIEVEKQQQEALVFQPQLNNYVLTDRSEDFVDNLQRQEAIRKVVIQTLYLLFMLIDWIYLVRASKNWK